MAFIFTFQLNKWSTGPKTFLQSKPLEIMPFQEVKKGVFIQPVCLRTIKVSHDWYYTLPFIADTPSMLQVLWGRNNTSRPEWGLCNKLNGSEGASRISDHSLGFSKGFRRGTTVVRSGIDENQRVFEDFEEIVESSTMNRLYEPQGFGTMAYECSTMSRVKQDRKRRDPTVGSNWTKLKCEILSLESIYQKMRLRTKGWAWRGMETVPETP